MAFAFSSKACAQIIDVAKGLGLELSPDNAQALLQAAWRFHFLSEERQRAPSVGEVAKEIRNWQVLASRLLASLRDARPQDRINPDDPVSYFCDLSIFETQIALAGAAVDQALGDISHDQIAVVDVIKALAAFEEATDIATKNLPAAKTGPDRGPFFGDFVHEARRIYKDSGGAGIGV